MPDRIPELDRLAASAREVPVLPPSEIRRRGTRRRITRRVVGVLGACSLLAVGGYGVMQVTGQRDPGWANPSPTPSVSVSPTSSATTSPRPSPSANPTATDPGAPAPTLNNLPLPSGLFVDGELPGVVKAEFEGKGQAAPSLCVTELPGDPSTILTREMGLKGNEWPTLYVATVFGYADKAQATAAFDSLRQQSLDCGTRLDQLGWRESGAVDNTADVPFTPPANVKDARFAAITALGLPKGDTSLEPGQWVDIVLIQTDSRVLLLSQAFEGQDYNCTLAPDPNLDQCPALASLNDMADRLANG